MGTKEEKKPKINLNYPLEVFGQKEFEVSLSVSDLESKSYDIKISVESDSQILSEIFDPRENSWQSSNYYLKEFFTGSSLSGNFRLKIKTKNFIGDAKIFAKIRDSKTEEIVTQFEDRIKVKQEEMPTITQEAQPPSSNLSNILISEVKIAEKIGDKNIFIEFYNPNSTAINLTGFYILRNENSFVTQNMLSGKEICSKCYFLLTRKGSIWDNIADLTFDDTLNENDKITLKLKKSSNEYEVIDEISWTTIPSGFSFGRKWNGQNYGNFEFQTPTPKAQNSF